MSNSDDQNFPLLIIVLNLRYMPIHRVIRMGHPTLRSVAEKVTPEEIKSEQFKQLINDLLDTMHHCGGVGIAAPQINISKQVCLIEVPQNNPRYGKLKAIPLMVVINPVITVLTEQKQGFWEGCLSIPGIRGYVKRSNRVQVDFINQNGENVSMAFENFGAVVVQHELDHLFGRLFVDLVEKTKIAFVEQFLQFDLANGDKILDD